MSEIASTDEPCLSPAFPSARRLRDKLQRYSILSPIYIRSQHPVIYMCAKWISILAEILNYLLHYSTGHSRPYADQYITTLIYRRRSTAIRDIRIAT